MNYNFLFKKIINYSSLFVLILSITTSCSYTRLVPKDKQLLRKYEISYFEPSDEVDAEAVESFVKQHPNHSLILGIKHYLFFYNVFKTGKQRKWKEWLTETIGEPPVIFDEIATEKTCNQMKLYLKNKGFYYADVDYEVNYRNEKKKRMADINYKIQLNIPYRIRNINYKIQDKEVEKFVLADSVNSLIKEKALLDVDVLQNERTRITEMLKTKGYFRFMKEYIYFQADTSLNSYQADIVLAIKNPTQKTKEDSTIEVSHRKFALKNVYVLTEYDAKEAMIKKDEYMQEYDTLLDGGVNFLYRGEKMRIKSPVFTRGIRLGKDSLYNSTQVQKTQEYLSSLQNFKQIDIQFYPTGKTNNFQVPDSLNCYVQLSRNQSQSFSVELEGFYSSEYYGANTNFVYRHKNLFGGAEILDVKFKTGFEKLNEVMDDDKDYFNTFKYGVETRLHIPKFFFPFEARWFKKKYTPKTTLSLSYDYQKRPEYERSITNLSFGYYWKSSPKTTHIVQPLDLYSNRIYNIDLNYYYIMLFTGQLENYKDHIIPAANYTLIYNSQNLSQTENFIYIKYIFETAGNATNLINKLTTEEQKFSDSVSYKTLFNVPYYRYLKSELDFRYHYYFNSKHKFVFRIFGGAGYSYDNFDEMPASKRYFSGGSNSIRAWTARSLGPGSLDVDGFIRNTVDEINNPTITVGTFAGFRNNITADIKLEANLEYRFKMSDMLEGALFVEAGNIWAFKEEELEDVKFQLDKFYKQLAVGTGFGIRFDLSFFIFRLDFGFKVFDPKDKLSSFAWKRYTFNDLYTINFGIGYPF